MSSKFWLESEKEILLKYFPTMGGKYCSDLLGKSPRACREMAKRLKINRIYIYENENP